jgi:hypothetical protein
MGIATAPEIIGKTPAEVVIRTMDFASKLDTGETLSSATVTITPADELDCTAQSVSGQTLTMQLEGGEAGTRYEVLVHAITSAGQEVEGLGQMLVEDP